VALKLLTCPDLERPNQLEQEARYLERCRSEHVVNSYGWHCSDGMEYLGLELLAGTLESRLLEAPLPDRDAISIGTAILDGVDAVHKRGVLHCDVKPSNIGLAFDGSIKLLDFGIACPLHAEPGSGYPGASGVGRGLVGTPHYMPPEQHRAGPLDERTDLYSVGAVLYELLTGHKPFVAHSLFSLIETVLHAEPIRPSSLNPLVDPDLEDVVMTALAKDPADRFASASAMSAALRGVQSLPHSFAAALARAHPEEASW
jgi:serine/threonine-protein kinase